jgi:hypothetical protein
MVEIEARDPGDPMPPREVGVALEAACCLFPAVGIL